LIARTEVLVVAVLSDIHGNLKAVLAVLRDSEHRGVDCLYNLGDTLGYGPNPVECLNIAMRMPVVLKGNFDHAVISTPEHFCTAARQSILWTQSQLQATNDPIARERWQPFLSSLSASHRIGPVLYVHGSPRNPLNEYLFPEDIYNEDKMIRISNAFDEICFAGHTHVPGIFREREPGQWEFIYPEECPQGFPVTACKFICNVGAVGQPRDEDGRASYCLFDGERIWFQRVEYDVEATIRKIYAVPELENFLGDRLREGR
jgi:diadenosine tetraphosphatase ApaH/serine/threonine PP2A family protein phosphatase